MPDSETPEVTGEETPTKVAFDYLKSREFRVIRVDGIVGGPSMRGDIVMTLWNERPPIPQRVVHAVTEDGQIGSEILGERVTRDAMIREIEVCALLSLGTAKALRKWLDRHIETVESMANTDESEGPHDDD